MDILCNLFIYNESRNQIPINLTAKMRFDDFLIICSSNSVFLQTNNPLVKKFLFPFNFKLKLSFYINEKRFFVRRSVLSSANHCMLVLIFSFNLSRLLTVNVKTIEKTPRYEKANKFFFMDAS